MESILNINRNALAILYERYQDSFKDLKIQDKYLVYGDDKIDISYFNINDLISENTNFIANMDSLSSKDIFKIIRLHILGLDNNLDDELLDEKAVKKIKKENPSLQVSLLKNVYGYDEILNITDSNNASHSFIGSNDITLYSIYNTVKQRKQEKRITPEDIISEMEHKLNRFELHKSEIENYHNSERKKHDKLLIPDDVFYRYLNKEDELTDKEKDELNKYYIPFLEDAIIYEEYLMPELLDKVNRFRSYTLDIQSKIDNGMEVSSKQRESLKNNILFEEEKNNLDNRSYSDNTNSMGESQSKSTGKVLALTPTGHSKGIKLTEDGFTETSYIIAIITAIAVALTVITFFIIK